MSNTNIFDNYNLILNNKLKVPQDYSIKDIYKITDKILNLNYDDSNLEIQLEYLFIELIRNKDLPLSDEICWELICEKCALVYSKNLNKKSARSIRMKAIRNNFLIREQKEKYNKKNLNKIKYEEIGLFVWDCKKISEYRVFATSDRENLKVVHKKKVEKKFKAGLPTQIDTLSSGDLTIGSAYSKGVYFYKKNGALNLNHFSMPIITTFKYDQDFFYLSKDGVLFKNQEPFYNFNNFTNTVWKARFIMPYLFVIDWSLDKCLLRFNIENSKIEIIKLPEIFIPNDICRHNKTYYVIDKMQGYIFSYDELFRFKKKNLNFGKDPGKLYDPISINLENGKLCIISWLNKYMCKILPF